MSYLPSGSMKNILCALILIMHSCNNAHCILSVEEFLFSAVVIELEDIEKEIMLINAAS